MRQLSFLPNSTKTLTPSEFQTQCFVVSVIRRWITPEWRFTHIPLGELRNAATAARLYRMGATPGWPDLMFCGPERAMVFIELKRQGAKPTREQLDVAAHITACGFLYFCFDSADEVIETLKGIGILQSKFKVQ